MVPKKVGNSNEKDCLPCQDMPMYHIWTVIIKYDVDLSSLWSLARNPRMFIYAVSGRARGLEGAIHAKMLKFQTLSGLGLATTWAP